MKKFALLSLITALFATVAQAQTYTCVEASPGGVGLVETMTVAGSGKAAQVHIDDITMSGDFTYLQDYTDRPDTAVIGGKIQPKDGTEAFDGGFLLDTKLLNGAATGSLLRMGGDGFTTFSCN